MRRLTQASRRSWVVSSVREMKDSGQEWMGEIPEGWTVESSKGIFVARKERAHNDDIMLTASQRFGMIPQEQYDDAVSYKTVKVIKDEDILKHVEPGDFVISMRSFQGGLEYSEYRGKMSSAYLALYPRQGWPIADGYYKYLFKSHRYIQSLQRTSNLVRDGQALRYTNFIQVPIPYPPLDEQQRIADYLDERCAAIDEVRRTIEDEVEALRRLRKATIHRAVTKGLDVGVPMRDSGVEWIGEIPENWETLSFKYVGEVTPDLRDPRLYPNYYQVSPESIEKGTGKLLPCSTVEQVGVTSANHLFREGQILYSKIRPALNKVTIAPFDGLCSADMYPIDTNDYTKWLMYYMLSQAFVDQIVVSAGRVKMPKVNQDELGRFLVVKPPLSEQQRIADYLDDRCAAIDSVIDTRTKQLERLEDYRKTLIFAYVTGKKEVPTHA